MLANGTDIASYQVFETAKGNYALRLVAKNGEVIARGQSYASKASANRAVARLAEILDGHVKTTEQ